MLEILIARKKALQAKQKVDRTAARAERIKELELMIDKVRKVNMRVVGYVDVDDLKRFDLGYAASCRVTDKNIELTVPVYITQPYFEKTEF